MELLADIQNLNSSELLSDSLFMELVSEDSEIEKTKYKFELIDRAKKLNCLQEFKKLLQAYEIEKRKFDKSKIQPVRKDVDLEYIYTRDGQVVAQTINNVCQVLRYDHELAGRIRYNVLAYNNYVFGSLPWDRSERYREWTDIDDTNLKCYIEHKYRLSCMEKILNAVEMVAFENQYNPVIDYLESTEWDGKNRIDSLLSDYLGVERTEYAAESMKLFMLGAISRVYCPGCKFDYMPVLVGEQGVGKSTFFKVLAGSDSWFNDNFNTIEGDKAAEKLRGMWIVEMAELLATKRAKEVESIKAFITSTIDTYRSPYGKRTNQRPRMCVFTGTTNNLHFMTDRTGNRRYLPLIVRKKHVKKTLFATGEERKEMINHFRQAWAEALTIFKSGDFELILPKHLESKIKENQQQFTEEDTRVGIIQDYLDHLPKDCERVCVMQLWERALSNEGKPCERRFSNEIHDIMEHSIDGWVRLRNSSGGRARTSGYGLQICYEREFQQENMLLVSDKTGTDFKDVLSTEVPF